MFLCFMSFFDSEINNTYVSHFPVISPAAVLGFWRPYIHCFYCFSKQKFSHISVEVSLMCQSCKVKHTCENTTSFELDTITGQLLIEHVFGWVPECFLEICAPLLKLTLDIVLCPHTLRNGQQPTATVCLLYSVITHDVLTHFQQVISVPEQPSVLKEKQHQKLSSCLSLNISMATSIVPDRRGVWSV